METERAVVSNVHIMKVKEAADYLRVHPATLYGLIRKGELPAFRIGSQWRLTVEAVDAWRIGQDSLSS